MRQLTVTRFLAAILVVIFHYGRSTFPFNSAALAGAVSLAPVAVSYFFALSGFILAVVYHDDKTFNKLTFYVKRLLRVYPAYLLALTLYCLLVFKRPDFSWTAMFLNVTLIQAWLPAYAQSLNNPGWSLSVEAFFYLMFPFLLRSMVGVRTKTLVMMSAAVWVAGLAIHVWLVNSYLVPGDAWRHGLVFYHPLLHLPTFICGIAAGVIHCRRRAAGSSLPWWHLVLPLAVIAVFAFLPSPLRFYAHDGAMAPIFLWFISALAADQSQLSRILSWSPFVALGEVSYSLYILQVPLNALYFRLRVQAPFLPGGFYAYLVFLMLGATAAYLLIEKPIRRLGRIYAKR
jgi:peptidoglycan/LPS O-acetylase OafA/YrhL